MTDAADGRTTPGPLGYALAVGVSLIAFATAIGVVDVARQGSPDELLGVIAFVVLFGALPAIVIGAPGACVVHLLTRGTASQAWAVAVAAFVGLVAGLIVFRGDPAWVLLLGLATGIGRLAVVPLVGGRRLPTTHEPGTTSARASSPS